MNAEELDKLLMAHFTVESFAGISGDYSIPHNEDTSIANLLNLAPDFAIKSKSFLCSEYVDANSASGIIIRAVKKHIIDYIQDSRNTDNKAMKYLKYPDKDIVVQQISMLAMHANFRNVEDIYNIPSFVSMQAAHPESVCTGIAIYLYYTLLINNKFGIKDYNDLFIKSWCNYYENWGARIIMFRMNGNKWKDSFSGVLLDLD